MNIITIDFETYYSQDYTLKKHTTEEYIRHEDFEVTGVAVANGEDDPVFFTGTKEETKKFLKQFDWENSAMLAHNTLFDGAILAWEFGIKAKVYLDTLCMARAIHGVDAGGSLKALAERYQIGVKGETVQDVKGMRRSDIIANGLMAEYGEYCKNDVALTRTLFNIMMLPGLGDGFSKKELKIIDLTLKMFIQPTLHLDTEILNTHLNDVITNKEKLLAACASDRKTLMSNDKFAELLQSLGVVPPTKISAKTGKTAWAFAKTDEEFKELANHESPKVQALVAARLGNKTTLEETRTQRFINIASRGLLPVPLKYYGAKTGRWSASDSINMQNLPRASKLKAAIKAPDGHVIVGADLSNIELRVGLWLSEESEKIQLLADGFDLYKDFASNVFNVSYDEVTKDQRFIGKTSQLSLIYGTGHVKLRTAIKAMSGVDIGEEMAKEIVQLYRQTYTGVVDSWGQGTKALEAIMANQTRGMCRNNFFAVQGYKGILLPSGLYMAYPELSSTQDGMAYKTRKGMERIYGAKVFQGLTQATARCIMAEHLLEISKRYHVALTVHDALYLVVKEDEAQEALDFVLATMRTPPKWISTIPLDAEGGFGKSLADC